MSAVLATATIPATRYRPTAASKLYRLLDEIADVCRMRVLLADTAALRRACQGKAPARPLVVGHMRPGGTPAIYVNGELMAAAIRAGDERMLRQLHTALDRVSDELIIADDLGQPVYACRAARTVRTRQATSHATSAAA